MWAWVRVVDGSFGSERELERAGYDVQAPSLLQTMSLIRVKRCTVLASRTQKGLLSDPAVSFGWGVWFAFFSESLYCTYPA